MIWTAPENSLTTKPRTQNKTSKLFYKAFKKAHRLTPSIKVKICFMIKDRWEEFYLVKIYFSRFLSINKHTLKCSSDFSLLEKTYSMLKFRKNSKLPLSFSKTLVSLINFNPKISLNKSFWNVQMTKN